MATNFEKLQKLLEELFQLDQADLDFGIYRIMNQKRDEVVRFLEKDLLPQVKEAFSHYQSADKATLQKELDKAIEQATGLGVDPETTAKVKELREQMADSSVDVTALENEVFSHLFNFLRRYYHEGDFISLRRYKEGVYAIPYEGEEVKLHWANHDQYYVKSSEYFRDYIFTMPSGKRVRVHLVAASSEQDNKKEQTGKERRFVICAEDPIYEENGELFIRFEYKSDNGKKKQDALNQEAIERVLQSEGFDEWTRELSKPAPTKANPKRTVLEKHLTQYTARNTFDYFIHKDLGGFLRRELDFYIKNEVMHLDDIEHDTVPRVEQYLSKIKVIRKIAHKIIQFLEQLENFQKKLWLKKKFVVETNYCITLDRVPKELYPEIASNDAQREEWIRLFAIDKIDKDLTAPGYSNPLTVEFLSSHTSLLLDTALFSDGFKGRLLKHIGDLEDSLSGLLIHGDNLHALLLLQPSYAGRIECQFIDPPYNTGGDDFVYKDGFQDSSWMAMVRDRIALGRSLLSDKGSMAATIDENEVAQFRLLLDLLFGPNNFVATIAWQKLYTIKNSAKYLSEMYDSIHVYARDKELYRPNLIPRSDEQDEAYGNPDNDPNGPYITNALQARNYYSEGLYSLTSPGGREIESPPSGTYWRLSETNFRELDRQGRIWWGVKGTAFPRVKKYLKEIKDGVVPVDYWLHQFAGTNAESKTETRDMLGEDVAGLTPKPIQLLRRIVQMNCSTDGVVCDYFAGSGTTGVAVVEQNRFDSGSRRYVLVESGSYFDAVLKTRIQKAAYCSKWSDGTPSERDGTSHCFKYVRLESYEDALNNLKPLRATEQQTTLLDQDDDLREQYVLSYMLDVESRGSQSLLNVESFRNPDEYKLRVERDGETQLVNVDLVETFNWLLGLNVKHIDVIRGVRVVEGTNPEGERAIVLWRNLDETDNNALDEWFKKQKYNTKDQEYDLIYVNGDNNLENLRRGDQTWKVRLIEEEFGRLMFDVQDI